jgi:outer membrane protein
LAIGLTLLGAARTVEARPLTLRDALERAANANPSIKGAAATRDSAEARVGRAQSPYLPQINAFIQGRDDMTNGNPQTEFGPMGPSLTFPYANATQYTGSLSLDQRLYDFGKTRGTVAAARATEQRASYDVRAAARSVEVTVVAAYLDALRSDAQVQVSTDGVERVTKQLSHAEVLFKAGMKQEIDVLSAKTQLAQVQLQLVRNQNGAAAARVQLRNAMGGIDEPATYELSEVNRVAGPGDDATSSEPLVAEALAHRPEVASAEHAVKAAEGTLVSVRADYYPVISANATVLSTKTNPSAAPLVVDAFASLTVNAPLFSGWATTHAVADAHAQIRGAASNLDAVRQQVAAEVAANWLDVQSAKVSLDVASTALTNAERQLKLADGRYQAGVGSFVEFNDARNTLLNAQANQVDAHYGLLSAWAQLLKSLGRDQRASWAQ